MPVGKDNATRAKSGTPSPKKLFKKKKKPLGNPAPQPIKRLLNPSKLIK
jgi:hypothetical protein